MNTKIVLLPILLIILSTSSLALLQIQDCVDTDPLFSVSLEPQNFERSVQSIPDLSVNLETMVTITPANDIIIRRVDFGVTGTEGLGIRNIVDQNVIDNNYILHVNAEFSNNNAKISAVGSTVEIGRMAARVMFQDGTGSLQRANLCIDNLNLKITGSSSNLPEEVDNRIDQLEDKLVLAENIQLVLGAVNLMATYSCREKQEQLNTKNNIFNNNCEPITNDLKNIILEEPGFSVDDTCIGTDTSDPLHPDNCNACINLYNEINILLPEVQNSCQRIECHNMISLEHFKETYGGDILGINYCNNDGGYYEEDECIKQYLASEKPKCLFADPLKLSEAAENVGNGFNPLGIIDNNFCSDNRDPITVIKSPSNDLFSSLSCGCLPGLMGWADLWYDSINMELDCVKATPSYNRNLSTCRSALYTFTCDMAINALTCGGLNFGVHSESAKFLFNSTGGSVNIEGATPQQIRNHINSGYTIMISGEASFDASELIHSICASVFGDADIDWSEVALNSFERSEVQVASLCPSGQVRRPCYCGSELSDIGSITNNCGLAPNRAYCDFDDNPTGECTGTVSTPLSPPIPEPVHPGNEPSSLPELGPRTIIPPADLALIPSRSNSDYRPPRTSEEYYYRMPSDKAVDVHACRLINNGVEIRVGSSPSDGAQFMLFHSGTDSSTKSIHKFHCVRDGSIAYTGDQVIRIEYHRNTGAKLPPSEQSEPDVTDTRATNAQIEAMADHSFSRIKISCQAWSRLTDSEWQQSIRHFNNIVTQRIRGLAQCVANYPSCETYSPLESYDSVAIQSLAEAAKRDLGISEYNRLVSLPSLGETGFVDLTQMDKSMGTCVRWISP